MMMDGLWEVVGIGDVVVRRRSEDRQLLQCQKYVVRLMGIVKSAASSMWY